MGNRTAHVFQYLSAGFWDTKLIPAHVTVHWVAQLVAWLLRLCLLGGGRSIALLCPASADSSSVLGRTDIDFYCWPQGCSLSFSTPLSNLPPSLFFSPTLYLLLFIFSSLLAFVSQILLSYTVEENDLSKGVDRHTAIITMAVWAA